LLCNFGADKAKADIIAILDSDRILPVNYFEKKAKTLKKRQFLSSLFLHKLLEDHSDEEIKLEKYKYKEEIKSKKCEFFHKNLFSGNTLFYKKDYFDCGGMDESFEGYGFADNDMTYNVMSKGYSVCWNKEIEIHLNHPVEFLYKGKILTDTEFKKISKNNLEKLKNKWKGKNIKSFIKL
jgi:predicted glycosyltransferase involved in capsule biosynthesis